MEPVIEPDLLICDPHHHFIDNGVVRYLGEELAADLASGHRVSSTVHVQCGSGYRPDGPGELRPVGETEYVIETDAAGVVAGIVGYADLGHPGLDAVLEAHVEAGAGRFRGIRQAGAWDASPAVPNATPEPGLMNQADFRRGVKALGRLDLVYEAYVYHPQLGELAGLARSVPEVTIVVDHLGGLLGLGPYAAAAGEAQAVWREGLRRLAACPNVLLKLGGLGMPLGGGTWHHRPELTTSDALSAAWGERIRWSIEQFGVERCMFESNFPVDKGAASYLVLWNAFKKIVHDAGPGEKLALFHDTAARTYRVP